MVKWWVKWWLRGSGDEMELGARWLVGEAVLVLFYRDVWLMLRFNVCL